MNNSYKLKNIAAVFFVIVIFVIIAVWLNGGKKQKNDKNIVVAGFGSEVHNVKSVEEVGCVSTTFHALTPNDKICVTAYADPEIPGVTCYVSQARTGGLSSAVGLSTDPSRFSLSCRQTGEINLPDNLKAEGDALSDKTSVFFKTTRVRRLVDKDRGVLIYMAYSTTITDGSPQNSLSVVPYAYAASGR